MMNDYLLAATSRYPEEGQLIHPISELDAMIIEELISIFSALRLNEVSEIMSEYKLQKDTDILKQISQLRRGVAKSMLGVQGKSKDQPTPEDYQRYIIIGGSRIDLFLLISYDSLDLNSDKGFIYSIILNPTPKDVKSVPMYANTTIEFNSESERELVLSKLDSYFEKTKGGFIR